MLEGELHWLTGDLVPRDGQTIFDQIEDSGAPALLLERFAGRLEYHDPWHREREVSHLFRGLVDAFEADALLEQAGHGDLRLVDNGAMHAPAALAGIAAACAPTTSSRARPRRPNAVARHMRVRGYARGRVHRGRRLARGPRRRRPPSARSGSWPTRLTNDPSLRAALTANARVADRAQRRRRLRGGPDRAVRATRGVSLAGTQKSTGRAASRKRLWFP